jgi:prolyl 3-hydroxylase /prolyl 3,4-dihydroxylase
MQILHALRREDTRDGLGGGKVPVYSAGVNGQWQPHGPCHKQRYLSHPVPTRSQAVPANSQAQESAGAVLAQVARDLFASKAFAKWLVSVTEVAPGSMHALVRRFRPGLDYTVATAGGMGAKVQLEATLCFVDSDGEAAQGAWGSDEVGGFQCYIAADEEATAAAETYRCGCLSAR